MCLPTWGGGDRGWRYTGKAGAESRKEAHDQNVHPLAPQKVPEKTKRKKMPPRSDWELRKRKTCVHPNRRPFQIGQAGRTLKKDTHKGAERNNKNCKKGEQIRPSKGGELQNETGSQ